MLSLTGIVPVMTGGVEVDVVQNIFWIFPENRLLKFYNHQQGCKNIIFN